MNTNRIEAFSDGVIAIIITIMVFQLKAPQGGGLIALQPLIPNFLAYILSFVVLGIFWNNHHHLLRSVDRASSHIMWPNLFLLFWLSLIPFFTAWLGEFYTEVWPTALYGIDLLGAGLAYQLLQSEIVKHEGKKSEIVIQIGKDVKGKISLGLYVLAVVMAFVSFWISDLLYVTVAIMWIVPDRRLEPIVVK